MSGTKRSNVASACRLLAFCLTCSPLAAEEPRQPAPPDQSAEERAAIPCQCRFNGRAFELGEKVCIDGPQGPRIARCDMAQNNTSWTFTEETCVISWMRREQPLIMARHGQDQREPSICPLGR